ncbi:hypothetical protein EV356DRAFT_572829, partial [Viridothelium virens]
RPSETFVLSPVTEPRRYQHLCKLAILLSLLFYSHVITHLSSLSLSSRAPGSFSYRTTQP